MLRKSSAEPRNPPSPTSTSSDVKPKPKPFLKPAGIIILPPSYRRTDDDDSPSSSMSDSQLGDSQLGDSTSLPDLPGANHSLDRRSMSSLNVKFAPLPQLAPRRRRSTTPLGIASRAIMMRRRRAGTPGYDMNGDPLPPTPPMWSDAEVERHTQRILAERRGDPSPNERDIDDPFLTLGKMVKGAGKQLWRKVNNKKPGEGEEKGAAPPGGAPVVVAQRMVLAPIVGDNANAPEEGGVWEEEVGDRFPLNVSQTETIVEGQYSWSAAKLKLPSLSLEETASDDASGKEHTLSSHEGTEEGGDSTRSSSLS
ncbi:hypothetical protein C8R44DRAFT_868244 [Mycena epipterygia]|nr:hypothetical protein C8R44DRAFT_868244 [Mycena epipterygia]